MMDRSMSMMSTDPGLGGTGTAAPEAAGFVVTIEGYTPYQNFKDLLDPTDVKTDPTRWGFVTRLENLSKVFPGTDFELFQKGDIKHFKMETGAVDLGDAATPLGIGVLHEIVRVTPEQQAMIMGTDRTGMTRASMGMQAGMDRVFVEKVLLDPLTQEEISKTYSLILQPDLDANPNLTEKDLGKVKMTSFGDPQFILRDHWFRMNFKLTWKGAPKPAVVAVPGMDDGSGYSAPPAPAASPAAKPAAPKKPSGRKSKRDVGGID